MKFYPVYVNRKHYRGRDPKRLASITEYNRVAARIERYLNDEMAGWPKNEVGSFMSYAIASDLHEDSDLVHRIVFTIDCGSNGVTLLKGNLDLAMERRANPPS